jgi:single-strand DNA-binding protein
MGFSINKIFLVGRLGQDPEFRMAGTTPLLKLRIAVDGRNKDETDWFSVNVWDKFAEAIKDKLSKGDTVTVTGRMTSRQYVKEGVKVTAWEVQTDELVIHTGGSGGGEHRDTDRAPRGGGDDGDPYELPKRDNGGGQRRRF